MSVATFDRRLPLALDSYWGLAILIHTVVVLAIRTVDEEDLFNEKPGRIHPKARYGPFVW